MVRFSAKKLSGVLMERDIRTYKGNKYYKLRPDEKIGIGALHAIKLDNRINDKQRLNKIMHTHTVGKTPSQFRKRDFFNPVNDYKYKVKKFNIDNIFNEEEKNGKIKTKL